MKYSVKPVPAGHTTEPSWAVWCGNRKYFTNTVTTNKAKAERDAKIWRDLELKRTDIIAQTPDWPNRDKWITYRTTLRDWPSTSSFPATRPNDPDYVEPKTYPAAPEPE